MQKETSTDPIYIADGDPSVCAMLSAAFAAEGYPVATFTDGMLLLEMARSRKAACIFLEAEVSGGADMAVLQALTALGHDSPIIVLSNSSDVQTAVNAIKRGASDFIEKPIDLDSILSRLHDTINLWHRRHQDAPEVQFDHHPDLGNGGSLTPRERQVLLAVLEGASSKEIARSLGISPRTVEAHRAHIMEKLGAKNTADLARIAARVR